MKTEELKELLGKVTQGEWCIGEYGDVTSAHGQVIPYWGDSWDDYGRFVDDGDKIHNARLIALAPYLARRVIAAEKLVDALQWILENIAFSHYKNIQTVANNALTVYDASK